VNEARLPEEVVRHYQDGAYEQSRITQGLGRLELVRTQEVVRRHLPNERLRVLDVGGGAGVHARWLAADGHDVQLVDAVPLHVEQARAAAATGAPFTAALGDARDLDHPDEAFDVVLLLGPLYHLTDRDDRMQALTEARRVLRNGGLLFAAAISRFASLFDGLARGFLFERDFQAVVRRDLAEGQHRNPTARPGGFTTAYFHHPDQIETEVRAAGLDVRELVGIEGLAGWLQSLDVRWDDPDDRDTILNSARAVETEPALRGLSAHLLVVAERVQREK
jgi:2-polyprenyl-3-methyl-5-hydroxy-6-metoxy-1,4-benzoquinol methylase